jgi:hypothetical protein
MAARERLRMKEPDFCRDGIFNFMPRLGKCIGVLAGYGNK